MNWFNNLLSVAAATTELNLTDETKILWIVLSGLLLIVIIAVVIAVVSTTAVTAAAVTTEDDSENM